MGQGDWLRSVFAPLTRSGSIVLMLLVTMKQATAMGGRYIRLPKICGR